MIIRKLKIFLALSVFGLVFSLPVLAVETTVTDNIPPSDIRYLRIESSQLELAPSFIWNDSSDNVGVHAYKVSIDKGKAISIGPNPHYESVKNLKNGFHTIKVYAEDQAGNKSEPATLEFSVGDVILPSPPAKILRTTGNDNPNPTFTWPVAADNVGAVAYEVQLESSHQTKPIIKWKNIKDTRTYTVPSSAKLSVMKIGKLTFRVRAIDAAKNKSVPAKHDFWPPGEKPVVPPAPPAATRLIKLADDFNPATFADATIFYAARDGKRYVFPDESIFRSWYDNFSSVKVISQEEMSKIPYSGIVTYRPGRVLVKLPNDPKIYAVARESVLRHLTSEKVAKEIYGENWIEKVQEINEIFFKKYTIGGAIKKVSQFKPTTETEGAATIDIEKGLD